MLEGKSWECSDCNKDQQLSRNCSLEIDNDTIEYENDGRYTHVGRNCKNDCKFAVTVGKFRFYICPVNISTDDITFWVRTFFMCEKFGCLPYPGSYLEQDSRTTEAFEIINFEINKYNNNLIEKSKKEMKQSTNGSEVNKRS